MSKCLRKSNIQIWIQAEIGWEPEWDLKSDLTNPPTQANFFGPTYFSERNFSWTQIFFGAQNFCRHLNLKCVTSSFQPTLYELSIIFINWMQQRIKILTSPNLAQFSKSFPIFCTTFISVQLRLGLQVWARLTDKEFYMAKGSLLGITNLWIVTLNQWLLTSVTTPTQFTFRVAIIRYPGN